VGIVDGGVEGLRVIGECVGIPEGGAEGLRVIGASVGPFDGVIGTGVGSRVAML